MVYQVISSCLCACAVCAGTCIVGTSMHDHARMLHVWSSPCRYNVLNHAMHPCTREARVYHAANPRPPHPPPCTLACLAHGSCHVCRENRTAASRSWGGNAPKKEPPLAPPPASIMHGWIHPVHDGRHHHGPGHEAMRHDASMMPFLRDRHSMHHGWQKASP